MMPFEHVTPLLRLTIEWTKTALVEYIEKRTGWRPSVGLDVDRKKALAETVKWLDETEEGRALRDSTEICERRGVISIGRRNQY